VKLRNYQLEAIEAVRQHWARYRSPAAVVLSIHFASKLLDPRIGVWIQP